MTRLAGTLLLERGAVTGFVEFDERITNVEISGVLDADADADGAGARGRAPYLAPGFIDVHVHGGGGGDTMDGPDGVLALAAFHLMRGTTTILPTTMTNPFDAVLRALDGVRQVMAEQAAAEAGGGATAVAPGRVLPDVLGAHLEGPFISPHKLGAQPPFTQLPTAELVDEVLSRGVVRLVTLAPEVEHAAQAAGAFVRAGVRVSLGHSVASYEQATALTAAVTAAGGQAGFTHLYNAMSQLGSREPGVVGAALSNRLAYAELIFDLHHVHPASFLAALAAKRDRLLLVTDAIRATGTDQSETELGGLPVTVEAGAARLPDGTLAGSVLTLDQAVRNAVAAGLEPHEAVKLAATVPAAYLGLTDRGSLVVGRRADIVVLDDDLRVTDVYVAGRRLA